MKLKRLFAALPAASLALLSLGCDPDVTIQVTSTVDGETGSLRAAIDGANAAGTPVRIEVPSGTYELTRCGVEDANGSGDLDLTTNAQVMILGTGPNVVVRQTCPGRVLEAHGSGVLSVVGMTLTGGVAEGDGGAIKGGSVVLSRVTLSNNSAVSGGGVASSTLTAADVSISGNRASEWGGGVFVTTNAAVERANVANNAAVRGGGIAVQGQLLISHSRVTGNAVARGGVGTPIDPPLPGARVSIATGGAGIWSQTVVANAVTVDGNRLNACTVLFDTNTGVVGSAAGGGMRAESATLTNSTISGNGAPVFCGFHVRHSAVPPAGVGVSAGVLELHHVTLAGNEDSNTISANQLDSRSSVAIPGTGQLVCGMGSAVVSQGTHSWFSDASCNLPAGNRQELAPFSLGPLADNGGSVPTQAPSLASPLVDAIPAAECPIARDARGIARPQGANCDIGAVEVVYPVGVGPTDVALSFSSAPAAMIAGDSTTWQLTLRNNGPSGTVPAVLLTVPPEIAVESLTATSAGVCQSVAPFACQFSALAAGSSATITLTGRLVEPATAVTLEGRVVGPALQAPLADDRAAATTTVSVDGAVRLSVSFSEDVLAVSLFSVGSHAAVTSFADPIVLRFHAAPGVIANEESFTYGGGVYAPGAPMGSWFVNLAFEGAPPAKLGDVEVLPGLNRVDGPRLLPVFYPATAPGN